MPVALHPTFVDLMNCVHITQAEKRGIVAKVLEEMGVEPRPDPVLVPRGTEVIPASPPIYDGPFRRQ